MKGLVERKLVVDENHGCGLNESGLRSRVPPNCLSVYLEQSSG